MNAIIKQENFSVKDLYRKGYTVAAAARRIGCSTQHLSAVLKGERRSARMMHAVRMLPTRKLVLREKKEVVR